jgi:hypothetical protein
MDIIRYQPPEDSCGSVIFNRMGTDAVKHVNNVYFWAAEQKLDIWMSCGALEASLREDAYRKVLGYTFAELVQNVLEAGCDVRIFVWGNPGSDDIAPSILNLLERAQSQPPGWGKFFITASGQADEPKQAIHFIVARSHDPSKDRWIVRVEKKHKKASQEQLRNLAFETPAAIIKDSEKAKEFGERLFKAFSLFYGDDSVLASWQAAASASLTTARL